MNTYTIAILPLNQGDTENGVLIACEPDGSDIETAIVQAEHDANEEYQRDRIKVVSGLTLTNNRDEGELIYDGFGGKRGFLADNRTTFNYAVRK